MDEKQLKRGRGQIIIVIYCLLLFQITYPLTAAYAANLAVVPSFVFNFERYIPFVPWMILPYMSSGLFFCIVPFYCQSKTQSLLYVKRFTFITLIAALCFILFPLRFSFERPVVENPLFRIFFSFLKKYDSPFNQAPSLHVAYACLFWSILRCKISGWKRIVVGIWLLLMGMGTLTVYQHHVIDVLTALLLVQISFILFPYRGKSEYYQQTESGAKLDYIDRYGNYENKNHQQTKSGADSDHMGRYEDYESGHHQQIPPGVKFDHRGRYGNDQNRKFSVDNGQFYRSFTSKRNQQITNSYYLIGWVCVLLALFCERYLLLLIVFAWVALVCFAVGGNYLRGNVRFLKGKQGRIRPIKKVFYAPYQFAYQLMWRFFRKQSKPPMMEVLPRCYVGPRLNSSELVALGLDRNLVVFDLAAELEEVKLLGAMEKYYSFPLLDIGEIDIHDAHVIIDTMVSAYGKLEEHENMIIHCTMGYSRSMIFATLIVQKLLSLDLNKAIDHIRSINRHMVLQDHAIRLMKIIVAGRS